jgi:glycosyltransferase involved in cell wall biosynthesis
MNEPLVTVVTSSWQRPTTVLRHAGASVNRQTYPRIEHLVVIDGDDPATVNSLDEAGYSFGLSMRRMISLGRNWSSFSGDEGYGATARLVGAWCAQGDLIAYLDDDNDYDPAHIAEMAALFEDPLIDFATNGPAFPPGTGRTDTSGIMHRAEVLKRAGGFHPDGYESDGHMIDRWIAAGLIYANKHNPTFCLTTGYHHGAPLG